jgi:hypothetical protein
MSGADFVLINKQFIAGKTQIYKLKKHELAASLFH